MCSPAEIVKKRRELIMNSEADEFKWLLGPSGKCDECGRKIEMTALMGVEVCFNAAHFGDLAVCILCPHCDSLYYMHACRYVLDVGILGGAAADLIRREKLIAAHTNNILEMTDEELEQFNCFSEPG